MSIKGSKSVGTVSAHVLPDTTDFASTLKSYLDGLEKSLKASIRIVTDSQQVAEEAAKAHEVMQREAGRGIDVDMRLTGAEKVRAETEALEREAGIRGIPLKPTLSTLDAAQRAKWEAELHELAKETILRIPATADAERLRLSIEKAVEEAKAGIRAHIPVDADPVAYRARIDGLLGDVRRHVATLPVAADTKEAEKSFGDIKSKITDIGGAVGGVVGKTSSLVSSFGMFAGKAEVFTGIGMAAISATGGIASLVSSTSALVGVAALLPAAGAMFAAVLGTGAAAVHGVGSALSAIDAKKAADNSSAPKVDPQVQALQYEQAQEAIARAQDQSAQSQVAALQAIHSAEESHVKALEAEKVAQQNLNVARADALKNIRDLNLELASADVKRQQDAQSMKAAEDAYNLARFDHSKSSASIQQTKLEFEAKQIAYQQEINTVGDLKQKTDQANAKGQEGADNVVAAKRSLRDANQSVVDSETALDRARTDANRAAVQGAQAIHDAQRSLLLMQLQQADAARQANAATVDAMAKLSPSAREAVMALETVKGELRGVQQVAQEDFFQGFAAPLLSMVNTLLPQLKTGVGAIATSMGNGVKDLFTSMEKSLGSGGLGKMLGNFATAIEVANKAIAPMVGSFSTLAIVGSSFLPQLAQGWDNMVTKFGDFIQKAAATGDLQRFIEGGIHAVDKLGDAFKGAMGILSAIGKAALSAGGSTLDSFADALNRVSDIMNKEPFQSALKTIFVGAKDGMDALFTALKPVGDMFVALAPTFKVVATLVGQTLAQAFTGIAKLLSDPSFMQGIQSLFKGMGTGIDAIAKALPSLGPLLGSVMEVLGHLFAVVGPLIANLLPQLAPIFGVLFQALMPLIDALGQLISAIIPVLMPLLQAAAGILLALIGIVTISAKGWAALFKEIARLFDPAFWDGVGKYFSDKWSTFVGQVQLGVATIGKFFGDILGNIGAFFSNMGSQITLGWNTVVKWFGDSMASIGRFFSDTWTNALNGVGEFIGKFDEWFSKIPQMIADVFGSAGQWLFDVGRDMINGLFNGINSMASQIGNFFLSILPGWMVQPFKVALGIHSPSRVFMGFGENIADGVSIGVGNRKAALNTQVANMVTVPKVPTISPVFGAAASKGASANGRQSVFGDVIFEKADNPLAVATAIERTFTRRM